MKIMVISDEVWNDTIHGNNVLSNWFSGFPAEFAAIYCAPGVPRNTCCKRYFQLTDGMMIKSLLEGKRAGAGMVYDTYPGINKGSCSLEPEHQALYTFLKKITVESIRFARELVWCIGRYDEKAMCEFVQKFKPDIIFCPRLASLKLLRLEKKIQEISGMPMVALTGDDEYSLKKIRISPFFWIRQELIRIQMRKQIPHYALYYTHSQEQADIYHKIFGIPTRVLLKCGDFKDEKKHLLTNHPIRIIYAGKLYCNRWKTLGEIGKILKEINKVSKKIILEIYTRDSVTKYQKKQLHDGKNVFLRGPVLPEQLSDIYSKADVALHVESFDLKNKLLTRYSFSTKIIDCLSSGCAVMAVCWEHQSGYSYLKEKDAAIVASSKKEIREQLYRLKEHPELVVEYAEKAYQCGKRDHQKEKVQMKIYDDFKRIAHKR